MSLDWTQGDLREGWCCFHSGAFFEAHEHWESVWLAAQEPEKTFLLSRGPHPLPALEVSHHALVPTAVRFQVGRIWRN